jgi:multisubunit Na+/H+ antiporter MnhF subunit
MSIDIWLFTAVVFFFLSICAVLRIIPGPTLNDRLIAINVAATLACTGALSLAVAAGSLLIVLIAGLLACMVFSFTIRRFQTYERAPV